MAARGQAGAERRGGGAAAWIARLLGGAAPAMLAAGAAHGQLLDRAFPAGVIGYGTAPGVTVATRARGAWEPRGVRAGAFLIRPELSVGLGATSNATGVPGGGGSLVVRTTGSVLAGSQWRRHGVSLYLGFDDQRVAAAANQSATGWSAAAGGNVEVGRSRLTLAVAHLDQFQTARSLDGLAIDRPGRFEVNNARLSLAVPFGRLTVQPAFAVTTTRFDDVTVGGRRVVQRFRNRTATDGSVTLRWGLAPLRDLVVDLRATGFDHWSRPPGQARRDATTFAVLAGIDYAADAVWRVRALAGVQQRQYADRSLGTLTAPMAEAAVVWAPSGLTTLTGTLSRRIEDAAELAAVSYTLTQLRITADHELRRNLLLRGQVELQQAEYRRGRLDRTAAVGASATWLVNRGLRVAASLDHGLRRRADARHVAETVGLLRLLFAL